MIRKLLRFAKIYGPLRALFKVFGRLRGYYFFKPLFLRSNPEIFMIGCGQFQFATIGYYLSRSFVNRIAGVYDINHSSAKSLADFYRTKVVQDLSSISEKVSIVFIASNHASHSEYAIKFLQKNISVFSEKPIAVTIPKLKNLITELNRSKADFYVGYNRPHAPFVIKFMNLRQSMDIENKPFSMSCFIAAHVLDQDHWYRHPDEGTRICGNVGHWVDLMVHLLGSRLESVSRFEIGIRYANEEEFDDDIAISISTDLGDLTNIMISSRSEPFEGIYETIGLHQGPLQVYIDDFRTMTIKNGHRNERVTSFFKNVGHRNSVNQPFSSKIKRNLEEIWISSYLTIRMAEMVKKVQTSAVIKMQEIKKELSLG